MIQIIRWVAIGAATLLCGCQTLPHFENIASPQAVSPKVSDITNEVQCEILTALDQSDQDQEHNVQDAPFDGLQNGQYVVNINLTLDVTDNQGIDPALSYIDPFATMGTNFTAAISGQLSGQQHRNINVVFTLVFDKNTPTDGKCSGVNDKFGLKGNLGIGEIIATGLRYETDAKYHNEYPYRLPAIGVNTLLAPSDPLTGSAALAPNFGATIDFTLIYGLGGGPNWTLTHFTGPNPASGGLLNFMRTNKETLVLSFARVSPTAPPPNPQASQEEQQRQRQMNEAAVQAASKAAQDNVTRMILQRLLTP